MHPHRQTFPRLAVLAGLAISTVSAIGISGASRKFYDDDPVWVERDSQDASKAQPWEIDLVVDLGSNVFGKPGDATVNVRAKNVNTVDEIPDSSWFTNRIGRRAITAEEITKGPDLSAGPVPGTWTITSAKSDGVTPGFTVTDSTNTRWFIKFDPPGYRGMATGTEVTVTKLMWALGYNVPENHVAVLRREQLAVGDSAKVRPMGSKARAMRPSDIDMLLKRADRESDGSFRVVASRALDGKPLGGLRFFGTRPDDPNDVVPHEHRRELRAYGAFAAWLNHVDAKAINSLDTLVTANGRSFVRHHLIDFGSTLGSGSLYPREYWEGYEYLLQQRDVARGAFAFGFYILPWRTADFFESPSIGRLPLDNTGFDPEAWRPRVPNPAFLRARADDKFWAARRVMALDDDLIRAAVAAGQVGDAKSEAFLVKTLIDRRNAIGRAYLIAINPIVDPVLDAAGVLTFHNAAVDAGFATLPDRYRATWSSFDNATGEARRLDESSGSDRIPAPTGLPAADGAFVKVEIGATGGARVSWQTPVSAYFRRSGGSWNLVGFERLP